VRVKAVAGPPLAPNSLMSHLTEFSPSEPADIDPQEIEPGYATA